MARTQHWNLPKALRERVKASVIQDGPMRFRVYWNRHSFRMGGDEVAHALMTDLIERAGKVGAEAFHVTTYSRDRNYHSYYLVEITDPLAKAIEDALEERRREHQPGNYHPLGRTLSSLR